MMKGKKPVLPPSSLPTPPFKKKGYKAVVVGKWS